MSFWSVDSLGYLVIKLSTTLPAVEPVTALALRLVWSCSVVPRLSRSSASPLGSD